MVTGEILPLSWSGWDRPCQCLHRIPRVHPWEGRDDLVGSCPVFKDSTRDRVSLLVWGLCSGSHPSKERDSGVPGPAALPGGSENREQACRNP